MLKRWTLKKNIYISTPFSRISWELNFDAKFKNISKEYIILYTLLVDFLEFYLNINNNLKDTEYTNEWNRNKNSLKPKSIADFVIEGSEVDGIDWLDLMWRIVDKK